MKVLLIRHATAEEQDVFARTGRPDDERPLTDEGEKEMRAAARGLATLVKRIDVLAASPLVRALQTADIVAKEFGDAARQTIDAMRPDAPLEDFAAWASGQRGSKLITAVGHNPHVSALACWLLGAPQSAIDMKKASALLLDFEGEVGEGRGTLLWYLKPGQLRKLSR